MTENKGGDVMDPGAWVQASSSTPGAAQDAVAPSVTGPNSTTLHIELAHVEAISFSHANSRFPVIRELRLTDTKFSGSMNVRVKVSLSCLGREMADAWEAVIPRVGAEPVVFQGNQIQLVLKPLAFAEVEERLAGEFMVDIETDGGAKFARTFPVDIDAYNQWQLLPGAQHNVESLVTLAPFVQPNHPAIEGVLRRARDILGANTDSTSTEGYQADANRVLDVVKAIYVALQERRINYSDPPASWGAQVQRVRLVPDVLGASPGEGVGTCLDTTITFASCLAAAGLNPVLILIPGHALVGVMTGKDRENDGPVEHLTSSVLTEASAFKTFVDGGFLLPVETTVLTSSSPVSFQEAIEKGRRRIAGAAFDAIKAGGLADDGFVGAVDVGLAQQNGLRPLPAVIRRGDSVEVVEYKAFTPPDFVQAAPPTRKSATGRILKDDSPGRIQNWKRALLDLSANNPLLKLPSRDTVARALVPPDVLGSLEDYLHNGGTLHLAPISEVTDADIARGVQSVAQLEAEQLKDRLLQQRLLFLTYGEDTFMTRLNGLARKAKTSVEESGSTSLFAGFGTLKWELEGKPMESPLILAPVRLAGGTKRNPIVELSLDDSGTSTPNFCLLEKLDEQFDLKIPGLREPEEDGAGIDVDKAIQAVREALLQRRLPFSVEEGLVLGNFQFSTFRIWKDVDEHWVRFIEAPVVKHLVGNYNQDYPTAENPQYPEVNLPLPADESQYQAIQAAIAGETFVLEGPPGTGKSQAITNIIAGALAAGKRVLFIAQKQAALEVVKQRLDNVGVGAFCLDLHGRTRKRSEVAGAIREALEIHSGVDNVEIDTIKTEVRSTSRELDRYAAALHTPDDVGYTIWSARQRLLAAGDGPALDISLDGHAVNDAQLAAIRNALENFPDVARLATSSDGQPWLLAGEGTRPDEVGPALDRFLQLVPALPTAHPVIGAAVSAATSVDDFVNLLRLIEKPLPPVAVIDQVRTPGWEYLFDTWRRTVTEQSAPPPFLVQYRPEVLFAPLDRWLDEAKSAEASGMFARKKKLAEAGRPLAALLLYGAPVEPDHLVWLLGSMIAERNRVVALRQHVASGVPGMDLAQTWLPYGGAGTAEMDRRRDELTAIGRLLTDQTDAGRALRAIPGSVVTVDPVTAANLNMVADGWHRLLHALGADDASVARWQAGRPLSAVWNDSRPLWQADAADGYRRLQRLGNLHSGLKALSDAGFHGAVEQLVTGEVAPFDALSAFERGLARASLTRAWSRAALDGFDAESHDVRVHRFATADSRWRKAQSEVIPDLATSLRPFAQGTVTGQVGELLREVNKVRGGKPLRYLLEHYHETLSTIMPCFLMSPESVAQFLRPGLFTFDLVVIDEASQVRVAEAIGALGRAQSAVIVGDSKQMPPSGFGSSLIEQDWDPYADNPEVPVDQESILTECIESRIPRRWLSWHYRSQAESLIAFSNANYYEGRLASFPTPNDLDPRMGLRFTHVQGGQFLRSAKGSQLRTNPVEATAIVQDIRRRLHDPAESDSIGVVTFNAQQQALIDTMLRDSDDELIREAYNREGESRLFVKNLENVQGDERDAILFSIGYSKDDNGKLPLQWGPLNAEGGERRLNVAITRARKQVVVFCSFQPEDIDLNRTGAKAITDLKNYLLIARDGVESNAALISRKPGETDRHRAEIAATLRAAGLHVEEDKGLSDFRVDLIVAPAADPSHPALVVLLDGPRWGRGKRTQDRDVVPVEVLGNLMGWPDVMRIWLPDWIRNRDAVVQQVLRRALAANEELSDRGVAAHAGAEVVDASELRGHAVLPADSSTADSMAESQPEPNPQPTTPIHRNEFEPQPSAFEPDATSGPVPSTPSDIPLYEARHVVSAVTAPRDVPTLLPPTEVSAGPRRAPANGQGDQGEYLAAMFVPAPTNVTGLRDVLDRLFERTAQAVVKEQILDVIEAEGPIHVDRLVRIVARRFGLNAVRQARATEIAKLIPRAQLRRSKRFGDFAWPSGIDSATWTEFRCEGDPAQRTLDEIAPEEITNAMEAVQDVNPDLDTVHDLIRQTAEQFGISRLGTNVRARLEAVYTELDRQRKAAERAGAEQAELEWFDS